MIEEAHGGFHYKLYLECLSKFKIDISEYSDTNNQFKGHTSFMPLTSLC